MKPSPPENFETLKTILSGLSYRSQCLCALVACEASLKIWEEFAAQARLEYTDSVIGLHHELDKELPSRVISSVRENLENLGTEFGYALQEEYLEPLAAIGDADLVFPERVLEAFYSFHNLLTAAMDAEKKQHFAIAVQQACESLHEKHTKQKTQKNIYEEWWRECCEIVEELK